MKSDFIRLELDTRCKGCDVPVHELVESWVVAVSAEALAHHQAAFDIMIVQMREDVEYNLGREDREGADIVIGAEGCQTELGIFGYSARTKS